MRPAVNTDSTSLNPRIKLTWENPRFSAPQPHESHDTLVKTRTNSPVLVYSSSSDGSTWVTDHMNDYGTVDGRGVPRGNDMASLRQYAEVQNDNGCGDDSAPSGAVYGDASATDHLNRKLSDGMLCDEPQDMISESARDHVVTEVRGRAHDAPSPSDEPAHSPQSSNASKLKRSASSSPSREQKPNVRSGSGFSKLSYVRTRGSFPVSLPHNKPVMRTSFRTPSTLSKLNHVRAHSSSLPYPAPLSNTISKQQRLAAAFGPILSDFKSQQDRQDSGYASRQNTFNTQISWNPEVRAPAYANVSSNQIDAYGYGLAKQQGLPELQAPRYDMVLQPTSSSLTQEQLGAEVKGIYAGLVMVEAKCITMDNARAADPKSGVSEEEWQTLIALHRTLLQEHHDFLMATQHPSANSALRGLASKYCMPARMWKHGIHAFLEVLRHRRPESQEHMLTFIYLAYSMMCLLFDTIPIYLDTWIECLGDLARYRMAIEEDKEIHAVWCSVAARWYQMAADRNPQTGRLYHHLGILERPSLRKFYFYVRSLTAVVPFVNAAESLGTLCTPILQDDKAIRCGSHSAEAMTICFHARVFTHSEDTALIAKDGVDALALLKEQPSGKICSYGVALAVTNIAGLLQYGHQQNIFRTMYSDALAREAHSARPSVQDPDSCSDAAKACAFGNPKPTMPLDAVVTFWSSCFNSLIEKDLNQATLRDLMQFVHVNLVWFSSLINLRSRLQDETHVQLIDSLFDKIHWPKLATFLNAISQIDPITQRVEEHAIHNIFLMPDRPAERHPLIEDYMLRGIVWAENYPAPELFHGIEDDDGSRSIETPARLHLRAERVLWLACLIAQPIKMSGLKYDRSTQRFAACKPRSSTERVKREQRNSPCIKTEEMSPRSSMDVLQTSSPSSTGDNYEMVSIPADVRSWSSMDESRISTPMKSFVSARSTIANRGSPERMSLFAGGGKTGIGTGVRIEGDGDGEVI